jgi:CubicO group peptidase (beta-lactamase class C family)
MRPVLLRFLSATLAIGLTAGCTKTPSIPINPTPRPGHENFGAIIDQVFADDATESFRNRRAVLISVAGRIVLERYYHSSATARHDIQSEAKTIMSTRIGIALDEKKLRSVDDTLGDLLPAYRGSMTPAVAKITLRQILTMTAGLPDDQAYYGQVLDHDTDWVRQALVDAAAQPPGSFLYSSAGSHLLSAILVQATGRSVLDYAREKLFDPLGIQTRPAAQPVARASSTEAYSGAGFAWLTDPQGRNLGAGGLKLTARDMVKLGHLWLAQGAWGSRQLVSRAWMMDAQQSHVATGQAPADGYGFQQWTTSADGHFSFAAMGYGGQLTQIVPDKKLVVVVQSATNPDPTAPPEPGVAGPNSYMAIVDQLLVPAMD